MGGKTKFFSFFSLFFEKKGGKKGGKAKIGRKITMKKLLTLMLALTMTFGCVSLLGGCTNGSPLDPKDPVTLTMWHNYGGEMQSTMDYLIDQFNGTVGKDEGIVINVEAISSSSELNKSLAMIANGDPGAPEMPDIFTGYPKVAMQFYEKGLLANLDNYFTEEELSAYVDAFVEEGRLEDGGLYVFPIAKSTEVLYLNQTLFDKFAAATGATADKLATFEGLAELSVQYYAWTDAQTPDVEGDGKQFYAADSWFNVAEVGMVQLGGSIFADESLSPAGDIFERIFDTAYTPAVEGGFAIYDGYSSDLSKTGDIVCSTGSSAGILFYGDTITYADGTVEQVEYSILPYPVFEGGTKTAIQRGGGLMVTRSDEKKEYAAAVFLKWLTSAEQNMRFVDETGYLPVTKKAFEEDMEGHLETIEDIRVKKMLSSVLDMYESYTFFTAPTYADFDTDSDAFEKEFKRILAAEREKLLRGESASRDNALRDLQD